MAKYAQCDNCGVTDDWALKDGVPILDGGALLQLRQDNGSGNFKRTIELCAECAASIIKGFPNLKKKLEEESA